MADARPFVLASRSPRRAALLALVDLRPAIRPADVDERPVAGESATAQVRRLALHKVAAVPRAADAVVLAADTAVVLDGTALGKPTDHAEAATMLRALSGRDHEVVSGVAVTGDGFEEALTVSTRVVFSAIPSATIDWYVATGESADKAGAYGIQGRGAAFVERVEGSWTNVVGLPLVETLALLARYGITPPHRRPSDPHSASVSPEGR